VASDAADIGLLSPEVAAGIRRVKAPAGSAYASATGSRWSRAAIVDVCPGGTLRDDRRVDANCDGQNGDERKTRRF
jgi:hypothetical protein